MSSHSSLICPSTPIQTQKRSHTGPHPSPAACPSVTSSSGNTINDVSQPATPSDVKAGPSRSFNRPRGKTLSSLDIFSIPQDISGSTGLRGRLLDAFNEHKNQSQVILESEMGTRSSITEDDSNTSSPIAINHYGTSPQNTDGASADGASEEPVIDPIGDTSDDSASDEDLKDLARHGLPSACIFVANLAATQTDDQLMKSLQSHFGKFGRLHVKIRRDSKSNPYSFCQFECDETARLALRDGRNAIIDSTGRRIRCEPAKVNRTLVLSKTDSNTFNENEARKILFGFGETESLEFARDGDTLPVRGLKEGKRCFIRFAYRQDAVDCYQYFRHHCAWTSDWTSNFSAPNIIPRIQAVEIDPVSVFIGKLNPDLINEDELRIRFGKYGTIVECNLVNRASKNGIGRNAFAFVKYEAEEMATKALEEENNSQFLGKLIHVQKREIHKKPARLTAPPTGPRLGVTVANNQASMDQVRRLAVPQSFPFSMEAVADLAARLSIQLAEQRDHNRHPSVASMFSNQSVISQVPYVYPTEQLASRHGSFQSNLPTMAFHQPFQPAYSGFHSGGPHQSMTPESPLSPRTAQAAVHGAASQDPGGFRQQTDDAYSGAFPPAPPHHQFQQASHMMSHVAIMDRSHHRDSIISIGPYDPAGIYGPQYGGGYTPQPGYHMQPNHHHGGS